MIIQGVSFGSQIDAQIVQVSGVWSIHVLYLGKLISPWKKKKFLIKLLFSVNV